MAYKEADKEEELIPRVKVRPCDDGSFDELFADRAYVHAEMMSDTDLWIGIYNSKAKDSRRVAMWISIRNGKLDVTARED